ncbi:reticulocyte-binding protein 3-like isoform X2 [Ceratina calcarata]|uniref:Reticulocyte-binding protein 3-like isoform X2 n=1 Tax=Ceratina calcarata TaxID=156304 RepID=A0AAJ7N7Z2_9HYME|nr:reticulocyte-binding protein 3-like isoform X2 [Ceratina calcarata]
MIIYQKQEDPVVQMDGPFDLLKLLEFLHRTLVFTEEVKDALKLDCDEADYCLKSWSAEACPQEEIAKDISCTCPKRENEAEEIATGISRALLQTQQLREKLSLNVKGRNYKCLSMYESSKETDNKKQTDKKSANNSNIYSKKGLTEATASADKKIDNKIVNKNANKKSNDDDKKLIVRPAKLGTKNFLAINKKNIKNMVQAKQLENAKSNSSVVQSKFVKFGERHSVASISELKELIQKVSINNSTNSNEHCANCPLHGDTSSRHNKRSSTNVTIVESFNLTDIPHEIIKSLKIYHTYLNIEHSEKTCNEKRQKMLNKFLTELDKTGGVVKKKLSHENRIIAPLNNFMSLFQTTFSENFEQSELVNVKAKHAEFCTSWKMYETNKFDTNIFENALSAPDIISNTMGCMSNGIWNSSFAKSVEGMLKVYCMRYTNKNQLLSFFGVMQQLQQIRYHEDLIKIIESDVFPAFKNGFDPMRLEYAKIYKMISILYQGLNPRIPVLVRTDK